MITTEKETSTKKAAAPSVAQINAEYVTQVIFTKFVFIVFANVDVKRNCSVSVDLSIFFILLS